MGTETLYYWLSADPPILRYVVNAERDIGTLLPDTRVYRLPLYYWHRSADRIERDYRQAQAQRPRHVFHYLVNESEVAIKLSARGVPASFIHQNAFLDERIFTVQPNAQKQFDAVYTARMAPFKRHALAREVPRLLAIGGARLADDDAAYFEQVRRALPQAEFTHAAHQLALRPQDVAACLNRARVGLCLSACDGGMYAATEYLLCGLPVVSTASVGGRGEWFDPRYVRIVPDEPTAISTAVEELIAGRIPPHWIRQQTLGKVREHRRRFVDLVQRIYDSEETGRDFAREFYARFFHKFGHWRDLVAVMECVAQDCPAQSQSAIKSLPRTQRGRSGSPSSKWPICSTN